MSYDAQMTWANCLQNYNSLKPFCKTYMIHVNIYRPTHQGCYGRRTGSHTTNAVVSEGLICIYPRIFEHCKIFCWLIHYFMGTIIAVYQKACLPDFEQYIVWRFHGAYLILTSLVCKHRYFKMILNKKLSHCRS